MSSLWPLQRLLGPHLSSHHPQQRQRKRVGVVSTCKTFKESQALGVKVACLILTSTNTVFWQAELTVMRSNGIACGHRLKPPPPEKQEKCKKLGRWWNRFPRSRGKTKPLMLTWDGLEPRRMATRLSSRLLHRLRGDSRLEHVRQQSNPLWECEQTLACAFFRQSEPGLS